MTHQCFVRPHLRQITVAALAGLLAVTAPANAESYGTHGRQEHSRENQIGALLFGLTALAVIAGIARDGDKKDRDDADSGQRIIAPPVQRSTNPDHIPATCLRTIHTARGTAPLYTRACMREHYYFIDTLPQHCFVEIFNVNNRKRFGWSPHCLSQAGYDVRY